MSDKHNRLIHRNGMFCERIRGMPTYSLRSTIKEDARCDGKWSPAIAVDVHDDMLADKQSNFRPT